MDYADFVTNERGSTVRFRFNYIAEYHTPVELLWVGLGRWFAAMSCLSLSAWQKLGFLSLGFKLEL